VVLASGGASYPATGSSGDGYRLAAAVGHTIVPVRPALVPLVTAGTLASRLQGLSLRSVAVRLYVEGKRRAALSGDVLFTHFGLSGPAILTLSRQVVDALRQGQAVVVALDLLPNLAEHSLDERLRGDLEAHGRQQVDNLLAGLLPRRLAVVLLEQAGIPPEKRASQVSAGERKRLRAAIEDLRLAVTGHRPWTEAQVTAGGVDLREVDPQTMASRRVRGLYLAGEVLDLDAGTGGYNLQAAFSTGWLAGRSAARAASALVLSPGL
jgi:predicted Rossmann fold flavoprotein